MTRAHNRGTRISVAIAVMLTSGIVGVLAFASAASATGTLSVSPTTGLTNGQSVTVTASAYPASAAGAVLECNSDAAQPTVLFAGNAIPVSCSNPFSSLHQTDASGNLSTTFAVSTGVIGPPTAGTDSAGNAASADAANYPCPPTAAQITAGDFCEIQFGVSGSTPPPPVPISFSGGSTTTTTTTASTTTTTTTAATTTTTKPTTTTTTAATTTTTKPTTTTTTTTAPGSAVLSVSPNSSLANGQSITVTASGYPPSATGAILECSNDPAQPTIPVAGNAVPVSCSNPFTSLETTTASGGLSAPFIVHTGVVGPPATGTDSANNDAAADAALYPCPPTPAQITAGDSCVIQFGVAGGTAPPPAVISFSSGTTTTTTAPTTTTTAPTTTTTVPCAAKSTTSAGPPSLTANPGTCLNGGTSVTVTGSGFDNGSPGAILECNNASGQPTAALGSPVNASVPVSCTGISASGLVTTTATGGLSTTFKIAAGTTGPPCGGSYLVATCPATDSAGKSPAADAALYPCPPTPAQIAAGASCTLAFGDQGGKQGTVLISFVPTPTPAAPAGAATSASSSTATQGAAANTTATTAPSTKATSLAFTGSGPTTWLVLLGGLLLLDLGYLIVTTFFRPRELLLRAGRGVRSFIDED